MSCLRSTLVFALLPALASAQGSRTLDVSSSLLRAADRDGGGVSADEWSAFRTHLTDVASLEGGAEGELDRKLVLTTVFTRYWDEDKDTVLTTGDLEALFVRLDGDANGELTRREFAADRDSITGFFARAILFEFADADESGAATREEWMTLGAGAEYELTPSQAYVWLDAALNAPPPEDKNAVTSGVYLLSLDAGFDVDFSGSLTLADFDQLFASRDADQNGELSTEELGARARESRSESTLSSSVKLGPPAMPWQRSLDDALAVSRRTGKPLLVCVNIDGESASESLAGFQYRHPDFIALARGFVPVLFSPDSHSPREYDDRGRRLPDPKFGRVITSEHTENETELYERYFGGTRVAPRHVGATADGEILFDIKLVNDLSVIEVALKQHGVFSEEPALSAAEADEQTLLDSPDAAFRDRLEQLFVGGDARTRVRLASLALSGARETQHPELLRMSFLDLDPAVRKQSVWTSIQHPERLPTELFLPALEAAEGVDETGLLLQALEGEALESTDPVRRERAQRLVRVFRALAAKSAALDPERWRLALAFAPISRELEPSEDQTRDVSKRLVVLEKLLKLTPNDRELNLLFADTLIRLARIQLLGGGNPTYLFEDARAAAAKATSADAPDGRALGYLAWTNYQLLDPSAPDYAAQALPLLRSEPSSPLTSQVLQIFAQTRLAAFYETLSNGSSWPAEWVAEIRDAHEVLMLHPAVTEAQVVGYAGFLKAIEAFELQGDVVRRGLALFPGSNDLHTYLRAQALHAGGAHALELAYRKLDTPEEEQATIEWFHGYALLVAAERHVENQVPEAAQAAYRGSVEHFRASYQEREDFKGSAEHYIALALAGSARLYTAAEDFDSALDAIQEGLSTSPSSSAVRDGLGNTPAATAGLLHTALVKMGRATEASALRKVIDGEQP